MSFGVRRIDLHIEGRTRPKKGGKVGVESGERGGT